MSCVASVPSAAATRSGGKAVTVTVLPDDAGDVVIDDAVVEQIAQHGRDSGNGERVAHDGLRWRRARYSWSGSDGLTGAARRAGGEAS